MMKRGAVNSRQFCGSMENSKLSNKYNALLEDYLELQKEYVSKKRKLQVEKQKREILLDEIRFLRQRHTYLTKSQFAKVESQRNPRQNVDIHAMPIRMERNDVVNETNIEQYVNGKEKLVRKATIIEKKPKNILFNKKKSGKETISWPDKVALRV